MHILSLSVLQFPTIDITNALRDLKTGATIYREAFRGNFINPLRPNASEFNEKVIKSLAQIFVNLFQDPMCTEKSFAIHKLMESFEYHIIHLLDVLD